MEYQVPQFIEVEDKIIGPLTLKQFIYLIGAAGLCVIFFVYLNIVIAILLSLPIAVFGLALAFYRVNGKPFVDVLEAGFNYFIGTKFYLWKHEDRKPEENTAAAEAAHEAEAAARKSRSTPRLTRGKLSELAWTLDIKSSKDTPH